MSRVRSNLAVDIPVTVPRRVGIAARNRKIRTSRVVLFSTSRDALASPPPAGASPAVSGCTFRWAHAERAMASVVCQTATRPSRVRSLRRAIDTAPQGRYLKTRIGFAFTAQYAHQLGACPVHPAL